MSEKTAFEETVGGLTQRFVLDGDDLHVQHTSDEQSVIDAVAKANSHGTTEIDGLGRLVAEVPIGLAMQFCGDRGIPWEAFLYRNDYDAEFKRFLAAHKAITYDAPTRKTKAH
jgi:hypothetical protein